MSYFTAKLKNIPKRWICSCKRINDKEDLKCAFCGEAKPEKKKGEPNRLGSVAKKTDYNGRWYQSKLEANYAKELDFRILAGEVKEWKPQHKIELKVNGVKITNYYIDFLVTLRDGSRQYVECKGMETEVWRLKWRLCQAMKDEIDKGAEWIIIK